uniref:Uncharacterized protein n=1 Tax=Sphaerodactylus townsendi TaxID=933632 RepID=A0ACB8F1N0_9SAUR
MGGADGRAESGTMISGHHPGLLPGTGAAASAVANDGLVELRGSRKDGADAEVMGYASNGRACGRLMVPGRKAAVRASRRSSTAPERSIAEDAHPQLRLPAGRGGACWPGAPPPPLGDRLLALAQQLSHCRTVLRLFDDLTMLTHTCHYGRRGASRK